MVEAEVVLVQMKVAREVVVEQHFQVVSAAEVLVMQVETLLHSMTGRKHFSPLALLLKGRAHSVGVVLTGEVAEIG